MSQEDHYHPDVIACLSFVILTFLYWNLHNNQTGLVQC